MVIMNHQHPPGGLSSFICTVRWDVITTATVKRKRR